ncbi:SCO family protein [Allomesorhizobium alhagi]|nr:SCO family protein [Mesorhizobium alhagi]
MLKRTVLLVLLAFGAPPAFAEGVKGVILDEPSPIAPFTLVDQAGEPFTLEQLKGRWSLIFLGFTHCPDVCPFTLANLGAVRGELSQLVTPEKLPQIVFLAVDPDRDRAVLADYVAHFDLAFVGVTGDRRDIDGLTTSLDGYYSLKKRGEHDKAYDVVHSAAVAFVTPEGSIRAKITPPFQPYNTAAYLYRLMREADPD